MGTGMVFIIIENHWPTCPGSPSRLNRIKSASCLHHLQREKPCTSESPFPPSLEATQGAPQQKNGDQGQQRTKWGNHTFAARIVDPPEMSCRTGGGGANWIFFFFSSSCLGFIPERMSLPLQP